MATSRSPINTLPLVGYSKPEIIRRALESCPQIPGRMEKVRTDRDFEVYIDYAHTPDALARAIKTLLSRRRDGGRLTVLFGCGGDREKQKRPEMGQIRCWKKRWRY